MKENVFPVFRQKPMVFYSKVSVRLNFAHFWTVWKFVEIDWVEKIKTATKKCTKDAIWGLIDHLPPTYDRKIQLTRKIYLISHWDVYVNVITC